MLTRSNIIDFLLMGLALAVPLGGIVFIRSMPAEPPTRNYEAAKANLRCLKGQCFLMPQESYFVEPLQPLVDYSAYVGDRVMTIGGESEVEIIFPDSSKLILRNTSMINIQKGRGTLLRELEKGFESDPASSDASSESQRQKPQSIIYVGNLPVEVLYPTPNSEIIPESFPAQIRVTFRLATQITSDASPQTSNEFKTWTLYSLDSNFVPTRIGDFEFSEDGLSDHYSRLIEVQEPGVYLLSPAGLDAALSYNGFRFSIFDRSQLDSKIQELLENYETSKDKPLEIRQR